VDALESVLPTGAWPNYVLGNHDESRIASRLGSQGTRLAAMLLLTLRGTPTMYYGDEIGMKDVPVPAEDQQDPWGRQVPGLGRDPCRTPMQWDDSHLAGCSPLHADQMWLPLADDYEQNNVERQLEQPDSLLNLYRKLLRYRQSQPALQIGTYTPIDGVPENCFCYLRHQPGQPKILVALNFSSQPGQLNLVNQGGGRLVLSTHQDRAGQVDMSGLHLRGHEGVLIELDFQE
jgi:alpha-glucosidase